MAIPGHPFETEALDELRSRQRRALALFPADLLDWVLEAIPMPSAVDVVAEIELRNLADSVAEAAQPYLDAHAANYTADRIDAVFPRGVPRDARWLFAAVHERARALHEPDTDSFSDEQKQSAQKYLFLLRCAEVLAGDPFRLTSGADDS